ncbi:T9SS C-terminal target domain-containing protein, partial [candidate division KSB1 bacterium]
IGGEPIFSHRGGFYNQSFQLILSASSPHAAIYFTLDGSPASTKSNRYQSPILINKTTVIRAKQIVANALPGKTITHTYFVNEKITLPVVSLTTDPPNLWDPDSGIYVLGKNYETNVPHFGANFWQDWERPVHIEFFEPDGEMGFSLDAGMKVFGGWSRDFPQKSLAIYARSRYGAGSIDYQVFPDKPITKFEAIVLRNSGNDWQSTLFRDGMMQSLIKETELDFQAYRPAVVFLNGEYWGILNIREKVNEHFLAANRDVDPDSFDLLENDGWIIHGDNSHFRAMLHYINTRNMQLAQSLQTIESMMDVDNFFDYQIAQIYFDNTDWPGNNIKFWRPRTLQGRWKWILFDTDFGFGLWDASAYRNNTLEFATADNGPDWPNPPWSTFLLRKLLENSQFKNDFINRFADLMNTTFQPKRVNQWIDECSKLLSPEIQRHQAKWRGSVYNWHQNIRVLKQFGNFRPAYLKAHFINKFQLKGMARIKIDIASPGAGQIKLNSLTLSQFPWQGDYFKEIPIQIEAVPNDGYRFSNWSDSIASDSVTITITPIQDLVITANFNQTAISQIDRQTKPPLEFSLGQNYPNPFNHKTTIGYDLPDDCFVTIEIFNMLGRNIATLVDKNQTSGQHRVRLDGLHFQSGVHLCHLSSGVYFYRIEAISQTRAYTDVKKMLYLK